MSASPATIYLEKAGQMHIPARQITELYLSYTNIAQESGQDSHIEVRSDADQQGQAFNFHSNAGGVKVLRIEFTRS